MSSLFIVKLVLLAIGFAFAILNFVQYREKKDPAKLRRAAMFFWGSWAVLIIIKVIEVWFKLR